jgi:hypothetical protein
MLSGKALAEPGTIVNVAHRNRNGWLERGRVGDLRDGFDTKSYRGGGIPSKHKETTTIQKEKLIANVSN